MTVAKYKRLLQRLLPFGSAWQRVKEHPLWEALAGEFCRVDERGKDLLREIDPRSSTELLDDWEQLYGIPDECTPEDRTEEDRRNQIVQKMAVKGSLSKSFYEEIGAFYGFDIDVFNLVPFTVGRRRVGHALTNSESLRDTFRVGSHTVGQQLRVYGWLHFFEARLPLTANDPFRVGENTVGQPLRTYGNELIECTIKKLKPAHSGVFFTFKE